MRRLLLVGFLVPAALAIVPASALGTSNSESATYEYELEVPNTALAPSGETLTLTGTGHIHVHPKQSLGGGGSFTHTIPGSGSFTGTWTATDLVSFVPYGCGVVFGTDLPDNFCGGVIKLRIALVPDANPSLSLAGLLTITCVIGPNPPNAAQEGIRVNVPGIANFNKEAGGMNLYIKE